MDISKKCKAMQLVHVEWQLKSKKAWQGNAFTWHHKAREGLCIARDGKAR